MPKVRDRQHGGFVSKLIEFYDDPTMNTLMEAYTKADGSNRRAIEAALRAQHIGERYDEATSSYTGEFLDFGLVHNMWLQMNHAGNLKAPLAEQFELLERLEEDLPIYEHVPLRRGEPE